MKQINDNSAISLGFERSIRCGNNGRKPQARINKGLVFRKAKVFLPNSALLDSSTGLFLIRAFFASIDSVLQTILSTVVGGVELTDVMQSCESRGRGAKSQIAPDEQVTRVICVITGLRRRAVADAGSSDCSINRIAGIG